MNVPMNNALREQIKVAIKNGLDISDLIRGVDIKGENLKGAIIKDFNRPNDDITKVDLSKAIIGEEGKITNLSGTIMRSVRFDDVVFKGTVFLRRCDCRESVFSGAVMVNLEYQNTDFRGCKFCETAIRLGTTYSLGSKFSDNVFDDLGKMWGLEIKVRGEENGNTSS